MKTKLSKQLAAVAVALSFASPAAAAFSEQQLNTVKQLVANNDVDGLNAFIEANPRIAQGNDPLAKSIKGFQRSSGTLFSALGFTSPTMPKVDNISSSDAIY
ncbi:hypothetical protein [Polycladidibacter hongkongensis]|uniref:hypothetical protein n=1 Tax=Polycladidibacter hongkongensis TaxID=1647556 RepID=UPI000ABA4B88|nr:hypothetical protein [Pseudovibrio hongkongensis]